MIIKDDTPKPLKEPREKQHHKLWSNEEKQALMKMKPISTRSHNSICARIHWSGTFEHDNPYYLNKDQRVARQVYYLKLFKAKGMERQ